MNEQELKEIWKSVESEDLPKINFEEVQKNIVGWHGKLRRKIKIDVWSSIGFFVVFIGLCFIVPDAVYFIPIIALMSGWGYWELWKIYKQENETEDYKTTKEFLEKKNMLLSNYIRRSRVILYVTNPLIIFATLSLQATVKEFFDHILQVISILVFLELFVILFTEVYFGIMYIPSIRKSRELIKQLESE